jgi:hypothetical protein
MVEMSILFEGSTAWYNFGKKYIAGTAPTLESTNLLLKPYHARIIEFETQTITFDTEQDKLIFMLRWA